MKKLGVFLLCAIALLSCQGPFTGETETVSQDATVDAQAKMVKPYDPPLNTTGPITSIAAGDYVYIACLGDIQGDYWLDGNTYWASVGLAPDITGQFTGTKWKVVDAGSGYFAFECQGTVAGNRYLDGNTGWWGRGTTSLKPYVGGTYSGTRWKLNLINYGAYQGWTFQCMGNYSGGNTFYLNGMTANGTTNLVQFYGNSNSGAVWAIYKAQ